MDHEDIAVQLRRTIIHLARKLNVSATDEGLTPSQASTLGLIANREPIALSEVARVDSLNPTMVSRIIGALESRGLVERQKAAADQRAYVVLTTPAGRELHLRIREQRVAGIIAASQQLSPDERRAIESALDALNALADAMP